MSAIFDDFGLYNVDVAYLRYLHSVDPEVQFSEDRRYDRKPFLGLLVKISNMDYLIPLTSRKPKHALWDTTGSNHFLVFEKVLITEIKPNDVIKRTNENGVFLKILAALDLRKMIPVPKGAYSKVRIAAEADLNYRALLEKEYRFCQKRQDSILKKAERLYSKQKKTGVIIRFCCNFTLLEDACTKFEEKSASL